MLALSVR